MDPWAGSVEWKGACSDYDEAFWTQEAKDAFSNHDKHDPAAAERQDLLGQRFIHQWSKRDDGIFAMTIEDFMRYFTHLTVLRSLAPNFYEVQYFAAFQPSHGTLSSSSTDWLKNKQFTFTFTDPLQKSCRVNILLEQSDMRMLESTEVQPPYSSKMPKIGIVIIEMSKSLQEAKHYEPSKRVRYIRPQGSRHIQASFEAEHKRYAVIPVTAEKGNDGL